MKIREMQIQDVYEAETVSSETSEDSWNRYETDYYPRRALEFDKQAHSAETLLKRFEVPNNFQLVAEEDGKIIGFTLGLIIRGNDTIGGLCLLSWICVHPTHQQKGIGEELLKQVENHCRKQRCHKITLYTLPVLKPAVNLYFKLGFVPEAYLRKEWWEVDFLKMSKWM